MLQGIMAGCLAALACSSLSVFVVWRRMSFIGDAVAHAVLPGVVLSYVLELDFLWGALGGALLMVLAIGYISQRMDMHEDAAIGVVFAGFFSLGILAMSRVSTLVDLSHILFGNILGVSTGDLVLMGSLTLVVLIALAVCYKEIVMASFDPSHAAAIGLSPVLVRYILLILISLTTVLSIRVVGVVLVLALLVTPAAAASFLNRPYKENYIYFDSDSPVREFRGVLCFLLYGFTFRANDSADFKYDFCCVWWNFTFCKGSEEKAWYTPVHFGIIHP